MAKMMMLTAVILLPTFVAATSTDQAIDEIRKFHGQTITGGPFYEEGSLAFDDFIATIKSLEETSEFGRKSVQELHEGFIRSTDAETMVWEGWNEVCVLIESLSSIRGCIDAPSALTGWRATHSAAMNGHTEKLRWLARSGADFNAITGPSKSKLRQTGFSPTHLAAMANQVGALEVLELGGANLHQKAAGGYTPLDVAIEKDHKRAIKWLLEKVSGREL
jgi:hypothetical protein